jgi:hypothetical protein
MRIDYLGNVGIGTTSPVTPLNILLETSSTNAVIDVLAVEAETTGDASNGFGPAISFVHTDDAEGRQEYSKIESFMDGAKSWNNGLRYRNYLGGWQTPFVIKNSGNVGIGTTSPDAKLSIQDGGTEYAASNTTLLVGKKNQSYSSVCFTNESGTAHTWFNYENGDNYITSDSSDTAGNTHFRNYDGSSYTNHMIISGSGKVGIGTTSPDYKLQVDGDIAPETTNTYDLGAPLLRWANIYTSDLHLKNEKGDWTVEEGEDDLFITNNKTGKKFKFKLEEVI